MHDKRTDPSKLHSTNGIVSSSQALSRTNENFRLRVRFRPGTRTAYKSSTGGASSYLIESHLVNVPLFVTDSVHRVIVKDDRHIV